MTNSGQGLNDPPFSSQPPPPASQSHFATFDNFTTDDNASFDHEFARLASSQQWVSGSQQYTRERTIAMREELKMLYFSPTPLGVNNEQPERLTEKQKLKGYQDLCTEIGIPQATLSTKCKHREVDRSGIE